MLKPTDENELAEAVAGAVGPLKIEGGGTRFTGRGIVGEVLAVAGLSGVTLYEPGSLTMVAKAGTPLAEIERVLAGDNQMLPFEPYDLGGVTMAGTASTIGGVFSTNASGARRVQAGAARDFLLGVRFVDGQGTVVSNGGRVMKNVTGYDLVKLMAGSRGTLGILTEVSFKVLPKPDAQATITLHGLSDADAVAAMSSAMTSPFDVTGAVHAPACIEDEPTTMIRLEGFAESVAYRTDALKSQLSHFGDITVSEGGESWQAYRNLSAFSQTVRGPGGALWVVSVKPSAAPGLMAGIAAAHDCLYCYDWAGGRIWVWQGSGQDQTGLHAALQAATGAAGGHATLVNGPPDLADGVSLFQPEVAPLRSLSEGLRRQFDPKGILNPGLMG